MHICEIYKVSVVSYPWRGCYLTCDLVLNREKREVTVKNLFFVYICGGFHSIVIYLEIGTASTRDGREITN